MKHYIFHQPGVGGPLAGLFAILGTEKEPEAPKSLQACMALGNEKQPIEFDSFEAATKYLESLPAEKFGPGNFWIIPATPHLSVRQSMKWEKQVVV